MTTPSNSFTFNFCRSRHTSIAISVRVYRSISLSSENFVSHFIHKGKIGPRLDCWILSCPCHRYCRFFAPFYVNFCAGPIVLLNRRCRGFKKWRLWAIIRLLFFKWPNLYVINITDRQSDERMKIYREKFSALHVHIAR